MNDKIFPINDDIAIFSNSSSTLRSRTEKSTIRLYPLYPPMPFTVDFVNDGLVTAIIIQIFYML